MSVVGRFRIDRECGRSNRQTVTAVTARKPRTCEELVAYLARSNPLPETTVLLTGTALVPPEGFTLQPDDEVVIDIEEIGELHNRVVSV